MLKLVLAGLLAWGLLAAESAEPKPAAPGPATPAPAAPRPAAAAPAGAGLASAAARRNENVQVNRIDNDSLKEATVRLGDNITIVSQPGVDANFYAAEHGRPASEAIALRPSALTGWHAELFEAHQNSVFNARTFFQVGGVLPSRQNNYGARFNGDLPGLGNLTGSFSQRRIRGMVNGNVLAPLESERTPLATDPAVRELVGRLLNLYPKALPNRPDFDQRALNTNAPQRIDETGGSLRLDRSMAGGKLALSHAIGRQRISAFQLVAGQNPDTEVHTHRSRAAWLKPLSAGSELAVGAGFTRTRSDLRPEPNAAPFRVRMGYQIEELGPDAQFPIDRAYNVYRAGAALTRRSGVHTLTFGGDLYRFQLNGIETNNSRGYFSFTNNFGRQAIDNLRYGTPSYYEVTLGQMARGFRNVQANLFAADQWRVTPRLQIYYGLRYSLETAPVEVNGLSRIPYGCDCNNFSPRFSIAWRVAGGFTMRAGYTVSFGQILPVTYQQARYNLPQVRYVQVQNPDFLNPLKGLNLSGPNGRTTPTLLSPDMVAPYSHQYNWSLEKRIAGQYLWRAGYVGSRTFKLLNSFVTNRAEVVPGIPLTVDTVDQRRADPRYYEVNHILNGGIAYMDAAQMSIESPVRRGLGWSAAYTFSKAIDEGSDYLGTAANRDLARSRSQSQYESFKDKKGLSNFDSTHSLMLAWYYDLPFARSWHGPASRILGGWQVSGVGLVKSGTPLTLYVGSDAPGFGNVDGGPSERPNIVDTSILGKTIGDPNTAPLILSRNRFAYLQPGQLRGNLGRGTFRKGGIANLNAAVSREWKFGGGREYAARFRAEAFNLGNHPQFDEPQRNLTSPAFGKITNTLNDGRVLQFSFRLLL
jgi:hypothetical protein